MHSSFIPGERTENSSTASSPKSTAILQPLHWPLALLRRCFHTYTYTHTHTHAYVPADVLTRTYACTHTRKHTYAHAHTHTYTHTHAHGHTHALTYVHAHAHAHVHAHAHSHAYAHTNVHTCTYTYACVHTHACAHAHAHTRTRTRISHAHYARVHTERQLMMSQQYACNTLQHTATHCNALQHTATHNTLQHTATQITTSKEFDKGYIIYNRFRSAVRYETLCDHFDSAGLLCTTLQHTATHYNTLQYTDPAIRYNTLCDHFDFAGLLYHTTTHCNALQHTATHWPSHLLQYSMRTLRLCWCFLLDTLQRAATHCNALQHTATHCNTLQHTAIHCNTHAQLFATILCATKSTLVFFEHVSIMLDLGMCSASLIHVHVLCMYIFTYTQW